MMLNLEGLRLGNYRLTRILGKGGFAEVYLGEHLYLKNYAAIKVLLTSLNEEKEQLFLSEAQTLARLVHPNIVRVRDFAIERSIPFLVMDYAPGGTLHRRELKPKWLEKKKQELLSSKVHVNHKKKEAHCFRCMVAKSKLESKPWSFSMGNGIGKWYPVYRRTLQKWQRSMGPLSADV
jgi:serine/threonine protein kinase